MRAVQICLVILTIIASSVTLRLTHSIMVPFAFAIFTVIAFSPLLQMLETRAKFPRVLAIFTTASIVLFLAVGFVFMLIISIRGGDLNIEAYRIRFMELTESLFAFTENIPFIRDRINRETMVQSLGTLPIFNYLTSLSGQVVTVFAKGSLVFVLVLFLLTGNDSGTASIPVFKEIQLRISRYLFMKATVSFITAILVYSFFAMIGLDMALLFAIIVFILNFIPTVGSVVATFVPLPVLFFQFGFSATTLLGLAIPGAFQFMIGSVIEPKLFGSELELHPAVILLSLLFWSLLWGIAGAILAMPIVVAIRIILLQFPSTKPIADLMAGRVAEALNGSSFKVPKEFEA